MEKISLLLLFAKKTLIGTAIAGILGLGGITSFLDNGQDEKKQIVKVEKRSHVIPTRDEPRRK